MRDIDRANVHTIHGFCQRVLADLAFESGFPFGFEVSGGDAEIVAGAVRDFWRRRLYPASMLVTRYAVKSGFLPAELTAWVSARRAKTEVTMMGGDPPGEPIETREAAWRQEFEAVRAEWDESRGGFRAEMLEGPWLNRARYKRPRTELDLAAIEALLAAPDPWLPERNAFGRYGRETLSQACKKNFTLPNNALFDAFDRLEEASQALRSACDQWFRWARREVLSEVRASLRHHVRDDRRLAYDDLLIELHDALGDVGGKRLAERIRHAYPCALIDEYQDTDPIQTRIFSRIYGEDRTGPADAAGAWQSGPVDAAGVQRSELVESAGPMSDWSTGSAVRPGTNGSGQDGSSRMDVPDSGERLGRGGASSSVLGERTRPGPFIVVGDPKQSIYRFRGADVFAYLAARRTAHERLHLDRNWRSVPALVEAVNAVFAGAAPFVTPEIEYRPVNAAKDPGNPLRFPSDGSREFGDSRESGESRESGDSRESGERSASDESRESGECSASDESSASGASSASDESRESGERSASDESSASGASSASDESRESGERSASDDSGASGAFSKFGESGGPLELWLLPRPEGGKPLTKKDVHPVVTDTTANEIARLLELGARGEATIEGTPLTGADIAVLVRTRAQGRMIAGALRDRGVRCIEIDDGSVFHTREAEQLERLLWALAEPGRESGVRGALAGDLFGLDARALLALGDDEAGWSDWVERLADWRQHWESRGIGSILLRLLEGEEGAKHPPRSSRRDAPSHELPAPRRTPAGDRDARATRAVRACHLAESPPGGVRSPRRRRPASARKRRAARQDPDRARSQGTRIPRGVLPVRLGCARSAAPVGRGGRGVSPERGRGLQRSPRPESERPGGGDRVGRGVLRVGASPLRRSHPSRVPVRGRMGAGARRRASTARMVAPPVRTAAGGDDRARAWRVGGRFRRAGTGRHRRRGGERARPGGTGCRGRCTGERFQRGRSGYRHCRTPRPWPIGSAR